MVAPPAEIRSPGTTPRGAGRAPPSAPDPRVRAITYTTLQSVRALVCVNYSTRTRIVADRERFPRSWLVLTLESEAHKLALLQVLFGVFDGCDV
jgi:hypothetical protein